MPDGRLGRRAWVAPNWLPLRPGVIARPRVTRHGKLLVCSRGCWSGRPASYRYRWVVTHESRSPSRTNKLVVKRKMRGQQAECLVTATNSRGRAPATSLPIKIK